MPDADDQIRSAPSSTAQSGHSCAPSETLRMERAIPGRTPGARHLLPGALFGGLAGSVMGALAGGACCWLSGQDERLASGALIGAGPGSVAGVVVAIAERMIRGTLVRPDIATPIGVLIGLSPALITALLMDNGYGLLSGALFFEALIGGPIVGLLIGGVFDRAYEASRRHAWRSGLGAAIVGLAMCGGAAWFMASTPLGPDLNELTTAAKSYILRKWKENPDIQDARIEQLTLVRKVGTQYTGFADATINGWRQRYSIAVIVTGRTIAMSWEPTDE